MVDKYIKSTEKIPGVYIDKYVVMPNHIHIILRIDIENGSPGASTPTKQLVPEAVGALKRLVSRETGENIFQRSYHDHIIRNQADYLKIWQYIDTNPLKWHDDCFYIKEE
ncbi:MAG: transposase [Clostridia bacterium]|nr:transposase [Clostridia bacterium]